jgi:CDP-4-dehydro-6-deoxyglucose reductase
MTQYMGVAKAARLLGVSRDTLQQLIRRGDLETFEGQVDLEALKKRFPSLALDDSSVVERMQIIRDSAYAKRVQETLYPSKEDMQSQIHRLKVELSVVRVKQKAYRNLFVELLDKLSEIQQHGDSSQQPLVDELNAWLLERIKAAESYLALAPDDTSD